MTVVDEIKERLDIVDVISSHVPLKKAGSNYKGLCPFHSEKTPSFVVFPDTQTWHCFGCNAGGDIFSFLMRRENMEFGEALRVLAERAGVQLQPRSEAAEAAGKLKDRIEQINALAAQYFHYLLANSPEGARARRYLEDRRISEETSETFQLGYARDDWQALGTYLTGKGHSWAQLLEAGLVVEREDGGYYDRFRGRLVFPIRDVRGQVVGFGARVLDDSQPKYLNSPQTPIFDKSSVLYGIDRAKASIREQGVVVIVEGYMDVLMAHQHERRNVVASMGTALTEKQVRVIKKLTNRLVLALDADTAGDQATLRGLAVAKETFDRHAVPVLTWRGLVHYEDQLDAEIRIVSLPSGMDPDEVIISDVSQWDALVRQAQPVVEYYLQSVISGFDLGSAKDKVRAADEVLPLILEISSPVERSHYLQKLARMLRVDERTLQLQAQTTRKAQGEPVAPVERQGRLSALPGLTLGLEPYVLLLLIQHPPLLALMNKSLAKVEQQPLAGEDFAETEDRALFESIKDRLGEEDALSVEALQEAVEPALSAALDQVLSLVDEVSLLTDEQAALAATSCALRMRELSTLRRIEELRHLQEDARAQADAGAVRELARAVNELAAPLARLQRARGGLKGLKGSRPEAPEHS
jgi:DNA primase